MTLSSWARAYVFSPLSRWLLMLKRRPSSTVIVLSTQLATMIVIGLWHGIALNFVLWGTWHGVGLFIHKQWSDRTRKWYRGLKDKPRQKRAWTVVELVRDVSVCRHRLAVVRAAGCRTGGAADVEIVRNWLDGIG